ncbi:hypothetical protein FHS00_001583 [Limimaricola variabilis]|uniref:Uncharacterized protein n=1 Tax=Limimaricola variabilis TaxID=1492771 RepID=A0ABR6HN75_9RHOB|nr:hypothetical protein [Limimaricola variabilis]
MDGGLANPRCVVAAQRDCAQNMREATPAEPEMRQPRADREDNHAPDIRMPSVMANR